MEKLSICAHLLLALRKLGAMPQNKNKGKNTPPFCCRLIWLQPLPPSGKPEQITGGGGDELNPRSAKEEWPGHLPIILYNLCLHIWFGKRRKFGWLIIDDNSLSSLDIFTTLYLLGCRGQFPALACSAPPCSSWQQPWTDTGSLCTLTVSRWALRQSILIDQRPFAFSVFSLVTETWRTLRIRVHNTEYCPDCILPRLA